MGKDFRISDIVDQSAIAQLTELKKEFSSTLGAYTKLSTKLAEGIKIKPQSLDELKSKSAEYMNVMKQLEGVQNDMARIQKEYAAVVKQLAEEQKKRIPTILEEARANDMNASAQLKVTKSETERLKQQKLLNQEQQKQKVTSEEYNSILKTQARSIDQAEQQNKRLRLAVKQLTDDEDKGGKIRAELNNKINQNTNYIKANRDAYTQLKMGIGEYERAIRSALSNLSKGNNIISNAGTIAKGTGGILKNNLALGYREVSVGVGTMIKGMVGAQAVITGIQKLIGLFKSGIQSIIDFEAANSKLAAVLGTTSKNIKDLTADSQRLGATTKYTASQAAELQIELAKLGFTKKEILQSTEGILKFAQATGAELPEAAALAGAALRMFDADTRETDRYVSAMAVATAKSALSFSYLATAMPIVGPVAKAFNFEVEDTLALLGKLADAGFDASMAATATRNILLNLADSSGKLAKSLGGPVKTLPELVAGLNKLKNQGIDLNSTLELTDKRSVAAFNAFLTAADKIVPLREQITGVTGELNDMADTMGDNVDGAIKGLSSAWEAFSLSFSKSTGPMKRFIDWLAKKIREVADLIKEPEDRIAGVENSAERLASNTSETAEIRARTEYNKRKKKLIEQGDSDEIASLKASREVSSQKLEVTENELKELDRLKAKALESANKFKKISGNSLNKFLWGGEKPLILGGGKKGEGETGIDIKKAEEDAARAQDEYMKYAYIISKKRVKNEAIDRVIQQENQENKDSTYKPELTDKEKRALEKEAKDRLKIKEAYQQSELDLMDEGLEKELAKIALDYNKKIAAVTGNSKEEQKTRENLAEQMQKAIEDKTISYNMDREKADLSSKLDSAKKGSEDELNIKLSILELEREKEIDAAIKTGEDVFLIDSKYKQKAIELQEKFASEKNKKIQEQYANESALVNYQMQSELDEVSAKYEKGLIDKEKYENEKAKITEKYAIQQARAAIELAKLQLDTPGLSEEDKLSLKQKIAEAEIALAEQVRDAEINAVERTAEQRKKSLDKLADRIQMVGELLNQFSELGSAIFDAKIQEVEKEQDANDKAFEKEQDKITKLAENGAISKEESEARKRAAEERTATRNEQLEKKKAELQRKQAIFDKANSIAQIGINTALAIIRQLAVTPFPAGIPFVAMISAIGAIQLATAIATPLPKYAKGTDNHPGGLAVVGDGGKREAIITPSGKSYITPDIPTLVDLPKHSMVMPDIEKYVTHRGMRSDLPALDRGARMKGESITVNVNNDFKKLEYKFDSLTQSFNNMAKSNRKLAAQADLSWMSKRV